MGFRIVRFGGIELALSVDDDARASLFWQYFLKPVLSTSSSVSAKIGGTLANFRTRGTRAAGIDIPGTATAEQEQRLERIAGIDWFHTIDVGHGIFTPGLYDHRNLMVHYPIPASLEGKRCLDVGTMNGFWAFELEKRGAAEVIGLDIAKVGDLDLSPRSRAALDTGILEQPTSLGFETASELRGSRVRREVLNVYSLCPERLGKFDLVFCGDLLLLLMNPMKALQNIRSVTSGEAVIVDFFSPLLPSRSLLYQGAEQGCTWWSFSLQAFERMIWDAGFSRVELFSKFKAGQRGRRNWMWRAAFRAIP